MTAAIEPSADERPTRRLAAVPVDTITARAHQVRFRRTVGTLLAALFYALGFGVAKLFGLVWFGLAWGATAVRLGWRDARRPAAKAPETS